MSRSDTERLEDIRSAISRCLTYRDHLQSAELGSMAYDAVLRNLAVVGEAVRSLPGEFMREHSDVPWALDPPMAPAWTARRGTYRILYLLDDTNRIAEVTAIRHRADAYRG